MQTNMRECIDSTIRSCIVICMANRDISVKVKLTVEEFVAFKHVADELGVSQSSLARWLIRNEINRFHDLNMGQEPMFDKNGVPLVARK